ncbi:RNA-binding ATPase activator esf2 [Xylographa carneopallida]|nr:RNA-binding ATPase activator esf2 [Xylographa carneopallida]
MTTRKINNFLDVGLSEEEADTGRDSEEIEDARNSRLNGLSTRKPKRRKTSASDEEASEASDIDETTISSAQAEQETTAPGRDASTESLPPTKNPKVKSLTQSQLASSQRKARKTGVIYLSRIPPFMRPSTIRHLLAPYGDISRLFLTPEPPAVYTRRIKAGGNKKRSFIDGWVEFALKKNAKICAETLNREIIGGKKGGWYHDDIWNIKYLRGFKWSDLMEQVQGEEKAREGRMRAELQREQRERKAFLGNVEAARREKGMELKRRKKEEFLKRTEGDTNNVKNTLQDTEPLVDRKRPFERRFRQNEIRIRTAISHGMQEQADDVMKVLSKIF